MPRASGVWIVKGAYGEPDTIRGVFTVKHECAKWLKRQAEPLSYIVDRYQDGRPEAGRERVPISELLATEIYEVRYGVLCTHPIDSGTGLVISARPYPIPSSA